jgi:acyl-CoA synthetase (AMP-forming)/AMP-acid ligase II
VKLSLWVCGKFRPAKRGLTATSRRYISSIFDPGKAGELCVAGYLVQKGYWDDPAQTASVMKQHSHDKDDPETVWMHTGDVGIMDKNGYLRSAYRSSLLL